MSKVGGIQGSGGMSILPPVSLQGEVAGEQPSSPPPDGEFKNNFPLRDGSAADKGSFTEPTRLESMPAEMLLKITRYMKGIDLKEMELQNQRLRDIAKFESKRRAEEKKDYESMNSAVAVMLGAWQGRLSWGVPFSMAMGSADVRAQQARLSPKRARFISELKNNLLVLSDPERRRQEGAAAFSNILLQIPTLDPEAGALLAGELAQFAGTQAFANMYPPGEGGRPSAGMLAAIHSLGTVAAAINTNCEHRIAPALGSVLYALARYDAGKAQAMLHDFASPLARMDPLPQALVLRLAIYGAALNPDQPSTNDLREEIGDRYALIQQRLSDGSMAFLESQLNRILSQLSMAAFHA